MVIWFSVPELMTSNVVCFTVAFDNVHLCHVSKMYCSVVVLVRKVCNQIGRHGCRGCYCYCSMCLACGYDARAEKACCIVVCFVGSIMYTYLIHFHPVRGVRTGWRRDIASVFLIVNTLAFYLGNCLAVESLVASLRSSDLVEAPY